MNRHADNDETTSQPHHELLVEIAQLKERERVLVSENDQLRHQVVEMNEQANKKYDDLMVQYYNMNREYEDDGTANNQVTVKTEWNDEEVKVVIKEEDGDDGEDPSTNTHNDTQLNIKTESMECDSMEVKDEIKEEDEDRDEDCGGCDRCVVKKEMVSDDDGQEVDNEGGVIRGGDHREVDDGRYEAIQPNVDCGQLVSNRSTDSQNASNEDSFNEGGAILGSELQLLNTLNEPTERTVIQSGDVLSPWTSTGQDSSRTALNQQATGSTQHNKRKQAQLKRTGKRSKKTLQDDGEDVEVGEDIANVDGDEAKVKLIYLNCTVSKCNIKLDSLVDLHHHLDTVHRLSPLKCFAMDCNSRFYHPSQIRDHIKLYHSQGTRFLCARCSKEFDSQSKTYHHWYYLHLTGQFQCNFVSDCTEVSDTRNKMRTHQIAKHRSQPKHLKCTHIGCSASFAFKCDLKRHESTHLDSQPFHCNWPQCNIRTNQRSSLVTHIRTKHFGLPRSVKKQNANNIVDVRDPSEYVRVVADE